MTLDNFYEKAVKGGLEEIPNKLNDEFDIWEVDYNALILMPKAWQAVGKVESWSSPCQLAFTMGFAHTGGDCCAHQGVTEKMHQMIDALIEGKTLEEHLETL